MKLSPALQQWFVSSTPEHPLTTEQKHQRWDMLVRIKSMTPEEVRSLIDQQIRTLGGPGSGNFGHSGRPGEVGGSVATSLLASLKTSGGFTYHPVTHEQPKTGYALSIYKGVERVLPASEVNVVSLARYVKDNMALLTKKQNYLGAWLNPDDNKVYLDVSTIVQSAEEAIRLAVEHKQLAYYDLEKGVTVNVGEQKAATARDRRGESSADTSGVDRPLSAANRTEADTGGNRGSEEDSRILGGSGSGNFGHAGRPGQIGGSGESGLASILPGVKTRKIIGMTIEASHLVGHIAEGDFDVDDMDPEVIEENLRLRKEEVAIVYDGQAPKAMFTMNDPNAVFLPSADSKIGLTLRDMKVTHNHPVPAGLPAGTDISFSLPDLKTAVSHNLSELRAVTPNGTFSLMRLGDTWPKGITQYAANRWKSGSKKKDISQFFDHVWNGVADKFSDGVRYSFEPKK